MPNDKDGVKPLSALQVCLFLLFALALLYFRVGSLDLLHGNFLQSEDGVIFINQNQSMGLSALWRPYMGYFHLYPRVVAAIAGCFALALSPYVLLAGWLLEYLFLIFVLIKRVPACGVLPIALLGLVAIVSLQPTAPSVFFFLANGQWMLGAAFALLIATADERLKISVTKVVVLLFLSLTGPFSVIFTPVLALRAWVLKDLKINAWAYAIVFACALIQLSELLLSGRASGLVMDPNLFDWWSALSYVILVSPVSIFGFYLAFVFWALFVVALLNYFKERSRSVLEKHLPITLLLCALLLLASAFMITRSNPLSLVNHGNRYTWIPYTLFFTSAVVASKHSFKLQCAILATLALMCFTQVQHYNLPNLYFASFANFGKYKAINIPTHPQLADYPSWHVNSSQTRLNEASSLAQVNVDIESSDKILCEQAKDLGIEIKAYQPEGAWTTVEWSDKADFSNSQSMRRWYPAGDVTMYFAFPYLTDGVALRFDEELVGRKVEAVTAYCLP